jgi:hypothetical protein
MKNSDKTLDKLVQNTIQATEQFKELMLDFVIGHETAYEAQNGEDLHTTLKNQTAHCMRRLASLNEKLSAHNIALTIRGLWHNNGTDTPVFKYRPVFEVKYGPYEAVFNYGPFFHQYMVRNEEEDLLIMYPKFSKGSNVTESDIGHIRNLFTIGTRELIRCLSAEEVASLDESMIMHEQTVHSIKESILGKKTVKNKDMLKSRGFV